MQFFNLLPLLHSLGCRSIGIHVNARLICSMWSANVIRLAACANFS